MELKTPKTICLIIFIIFIEALTPIKYLYSSDFLQFRNMALVLAVLLLLPIRFTTYNILIYILTNFYLTAVSLAKITISYDFSVSRFFSELIALNLILYIILFSYEKSRHMTYDSGLDISIRAAVTIFMVNVFVAIIFTSLGYRSHAGELILPILLYYILCKKKGSLLSAAYISLLAFLGNSRGFGISIVFASAASRRLGVGFGIMTLSILSIYFASTLELIRNLNFSLLRENSLDFINLASSGRLNEILILYENWNERFFGVGVGIVFNQQGGSFWSHSFFFNLAYKAGLIGIVLFSIIFIAYLKPNNQTQLGYLAGMILYSNLDFSILFNPVWVILYRRLGT